MIVFLSHSFSPYDAPIAARLKAIAAAYGIQLLLPDRTHSYRRNLPSAETRQKIRRSDAVVGLATQNAAPQQALELELSEALSTGKPVVALVEDGVAIQGIPAMQIVRFDRNNPAAHEDKLLKVLTKIQQQKQQSQELVTALGWIAGIALGMVALNALAETISGKNGTR